MLKGIDPLLSPDLLQVLAAMVHGDEILIDDANIPAFALAARLCRLDGANTSSALRAILSVLPLDQYVEQPAAIMAVVDDPDAIPETEVEFRSLLDAAEGKSVAIQRLERFSFYDRAREMFAIVITGEQRLYGNIILTKGVVAPPSNGTS